MCGGPGRGVRDHCSGRLHSQHEEGRPLQPLRLSLSLWQDVFGSKSAAPRPPACASL